MMMWNPFWGFFGFVGWLFMLLFWGAVIGVPLARILARTGFNPWYALFALVPGLNVIMLWIFAWAKWPAAPGAE